MTMRATAIAAAAAVLLFTDIGKAEDVDAKAQSILEQGLASKNPDTRKQAVAALSLAASREPYLSRLISMMGDKDVEVRLSTVASLSEIKGKAVNKTLQNALNDEVPEVTFAAAKALVGPP